MGFCPLYMEKPLVIMLILGYFSSPACLLVETGRVILLFVSNKGLKQNNLSLEVGFKRERD